MNTNIIDYGAVSGGGLCTEAIQRAIDECERSGGGRVTVPPGLYKTGTIWLKSNVELHLEHGSILKASDNLDDYNSLDAYEQNYGCDSERWVGKHMIIAHETTNSALTGTGTLDGSGDAFFGGKSRFNGYAWRNGLGVVKDPEKMRPGQLVCFIECRKVTVRDIELTNMPCWGLFMIGCEYVTVQGLRVFNPDWFTNSDGIDIDCCRFVTVSDCVINTGDDAIAIRGVARRVLHGGSKVTEYITISNCVLASSACAFRVGVGDGLIRHVRVSNITIDRAASGVCLQTDYAGSGSVDIEDVSFSGLSATNIGYPARIAEGNGAYIRDITIENYTAEHMAALYITARHEDTISDIKVRNCTFTAIDSPFEITPSVKQTRGAALCDCTNVSRLGLDNVEFRITPERMKLWDGIYRLTGCTGTIEGKPIKEG